MSKDAFRIFVVEDNEWFRKLLVHNLGLNPDYEVHAFETGGQCLEALRLKPDVITLDFRLPDMDGAEVMKRINAHDEGIEIIIISEQDDVETAVELLKSGAYDYLVKTNDIRDRLLNSVRKIREQRALRSEVSQLRQEVQTKYDFQKSIIGNSAAIRKVFELIEKAITTNITVSIIGETGTGKEVVAKTIHYSSNRKNKSFVAVNVAAIPKDLMESELFGHEKGAFTGAVSRRIGKFEEASGGTLFLDEVSEMDITLQAKLLRAIQEREVVRVGSNQPVKTDCRIIVASNKNLQQQVKAGEFREDLYYRLLGLPIELPPLRDRENDVLVLARFFADSFCKENNLPAKSFTPDAQRKLMGHDFPGNVRELKSLIELSVVMSSTDTITADDLQVDGDSVLPNVMSEDLTMREYELRILDAYLKRCDNNIKLVAEKLDIGQSTIYRMLKEMKPSGE
jgi:DNA-binding NtrC family response regulator